MMNPPPSIIIATHGHAMAHRDSNGSMATSPTNQHTNAKFTVNTGPKASTSPSHAHNSSLISYHSQPSDRSLPSLPNTAGGAQPNAQRYPDAPSPTKPSSPTGASPIPQFPSPIPIGHMRAGSLIRTSRASSRTGSPDRNTHPPLHNNANTTSTTQQSSSGAANAGERVEVKNDSHFDTLDDQLLRSPSYSELYRIVRMCSAQGSCERMVTVLEKQIHHLLYCQCRVVLVQKDGLYHSKGFVANLNAGLVGYVRNKREIVNIVMPAQDDRYFAEIDQLVDRVPYAYLCIPIEADSRSDCSGLKDVVAVIQCHREQEPFHPREAKLLLRLGEFVGNMLRNSRSADRAHALYNASLQSHKRSAALLDVAKALASEIRLEHIVGIIVSQVPELLDCDRCTLFFVDREREQLIVTKGSSKGRQKTLVSWIFGQSNAPELPFPKGHNEIRFSIHNGIAGHVAMTGETVNIPDAHQDPRFDSSWDSKTGYLTRSILCVPMQDANGVLIGVLQAINKNLFGRFDGADETLLKTFSAQAALAVRNSQLIHKTTTALRQSDALLQVTKALSGELKIEALIQIVCSKVQDLLQAERCTVFIVDKERKELYTSEHMSYGMGASLPIDRDRAQLLYFPMDRGIAGSVATTGQIVNIADAYQDSRFNQTFDRQTGFRTRSILCMAIQNSRQEIAGVVQVMNKHKLDDYVRFDEEDEKLLDAFCAQAAVAIENSRLFTTTERALNSALAEQRNMKFMLSVTKNLFSDMHLTSMIDQMTMQVHHLLKADDVCEH